MTNKLKVIFITQDAPFYLPLYIDLVLQNLGKEIEVIKVYTTSAVLTNRNFLKTVKDFLSYFGVIVFIYMALLRIYYFISDLFNQFIKMGRRFHSVKLVCKKYGIAYSRVDNISSDAFLRNMMTLKPDVIFSIACTQIFSKELISIPSKGCLNIHSALLPKYRGMNAPFWAMAKGEKLSGVTIHYINPQIDDGDILMQEEIKILDGWSLNDLYLKGINIGSDMIAKCLRNVHNNNIVTLKNDISKSSYYTFPTRKDVKAFRANKGKFFKYY